MDADEGKKVVLIAPDSEDDDHGNPKLLVAPDSEDDDRGDLNLLVVPDSKDSEEHGGPKRRHPFRRVRRPEERRRSRHGAVAIELPAQLTERNSAAAIELPVQGSERNIDIIEPIAQGVKCSDELIELAAQEEEELFEGQKP